MPTRKLDYLVLVARVVVGAFFVYASLDKISDPAAFAKIVHNYRFLPGDLVNILAIFLPWLELLCGMALIMGTNARGAAAIISIMLVAFIIAVSSAIARGIKIDCGCFTTSGDGARKVGLPLLIEDILLLALALLIWFRGARVWALDHLRPRRTAHA
jgi:uncharacterized membrane protein YphA (DoxX/SURF4 family)